MISMQLKMNRKKLFQLSFSDLKMIKMRLCAFLGADLWIELLDSFLIKKIGVYVEMTSSNCIQFDTHSKSEGPRETLFISWCLELNLG